MLRIAEQFYSIQGEGPTVGTPAVFLRTQHCNLLCGGIGTERDGKLHTDATWRCDTIEVWLKGREYTSKELMENWEQEGWLEHIANGAHVVLTGGEPLLQQTELADFLAYLPPTTHIEVETNATKLPLPAFDQYIAQYSCSPKLANSGMPRERRAIPAALKWHARTSRSIFKFVVTTESDVAEAIRDIVEPYFLRPDRMYIMAAAETRAELLESGPSVAALCMRYGFQYSPRLHIELWDRKTGV